MKRWANIGLLCAALATTSATSLPLRAEAPAAEETSAEIASRQKALFVRGNKLYDEKKWAAARDVYLEAWNLKKSHDLAGNLGDVELTLGDPRSAAEHLDYALRYFPAGGKPALRAQLERRFLQARALIGALRIGSKPGAEVLVDGQLVGYAPIQVPIFVSPGPHEVVVRHEGYETATVTVEALAGEEHRVALALTRNTLPPAAATSPRSVAPDGAPASAPHAETRSWVPVLALGAASLVALGVGVGTTVASNEASESKEAKQRALRAEIVGCVDAPSAYEGACADLRSAVERTDTLANAARVAYATSAVLAAAAVTYALWPRAKTGATAQVRVLPDLQATTTGVVLLGTW